MINSNLGHRREGLFSEALSGRVRFGREGRKPHAQKENGPLVIDDSP